MMFELYNSPNAASFSNSEPATLYTAAKAVYGYREMLNMEPAPFDFVPRRAPRGGLGSLKELFLKLRTPRTPALRTQRGAMANG